MIQIEACITISLIEIKKKKKLTRLSQVEASTYHHILLITILTHLNLFRSRTHSFK